MKEQRIVLINGQVHDCSFGSGPKEYDELVEFDSFEEKETYISSLQKYQAVFNEDGSYELKHGCVTCESKSFDTEEERDAFLLLPDGKKFNGSGEAVDKTTEEIAADNQVRADEILEELKQFDDYILKCAADGLIFSEYYPELSEQRDTLRAERKALLI